MKRIVDSCGEYTRETFTKRDRDGGVYTRTRITTEKGIYDYERYSPKEETYTMFDSYDADMCRSSMKKMEEAYQEYCESKECK